MQPKITLTATAGTQQGQQFTFDSPTIYTIGRNPECNIYLDDNTISRHHCQLDINPPEVRVCDLNSLLGTRVNGKLIGKRNHHESKRKVCQLQDGDEISLGNHVFRLKIELISEADEIIAPVPISATEFSIPSTGLPTIEGYTTLKLLGKGGMGAVYLVRHNETGEEMALKTLLPQIAVNQRGINLFLREIENTKALHHPHVVELRDHGYCNGMFFFTLEYCNGGTVVDLMQSKGGCLSISEAISIIVQVLDGLHYAHQAEIPYVRLAGGKIGKGRGLVHRDLKPNNIFLCCQGDGYTAKVGDYGLAKAFDQAGLSGFSHTDRSAGTLEFMSKQQALNFKYAEPDVDVWAAAACLYYLLTGCYPRDFCESEPRLTVLEVPAVPIRQRDASIPECLANLIDLALRETPGIYFRNAVALKRALLSVVSLVP
ncbi:MAG: FHA domain-containing protein [Kamptonema sp. SIO1D9]|nr:FHA domain-containing protein [Kamptonema sp. SIO1D9]